jgi:outer membrane protein assembly factor BamE (lipoprotein component of BamABCDE complex)
VSRIASAAALVLALAACGKGSNEAAEAPARTDSLIDVQQEAQRVRVGMTEAEVVKILGQPRNRVRAAGGNRLTFWTFDGQKNVKARVYVTLDSQGKVAEVETIPL